jgi:hypothetical protein
LNIFPYATLRNWEDRLASHKKPFHDDRPIQSIGSSAQLQDFELDDGDGVLHPVLANIILNETPTQLAQLGDNPTPESLLSVVGENIALNSKQALVMRKLLSEILAWVDYPYDSSRRKQLLLCITGEGGTGKTQIPKAIEAALDFLGRKHELILTAPTGAAADNLGGNTYHTSLGINLS